jgi:hypothetical protein
LWRRLQRHGRNLRFLDAGPAGLYIAAHDDHDHDPPRNAPPRLFGAGWRSLIVSRAAEGRAARLPIPAPILVALTAKD